MDESTRALNALRAAMQTERARAAQGLVSRGRAMGNDADVLSDGPRSINDIVLDDDTLPSAPLTDVLRRRHSSRGGPAPAREQVLATLSRAALDRPTRSLSVRRPYPSPGATHPHTLVLRCQGVSGLDGSWVFDSAWARLRPAARLEHATRRGATQVHAQLRGFQPDAIVWTIARPERLLHRYPSGTSMLWREAGALAQTVHLAATDLGLGSCILGTIGAVLDLSEPFPNFVDTGAIALFGGAS